MCCILFIMQSSEAIQKLCVRKKFVKMHCITFEILHFNLPLISAENSFYCFHHLRKHCSLVLCVGLTTGVIKSIIWLSFSFSPGWFSSTKDALQTNRAKPEMADTGFYLTTLTFLLPSFSAEVLACEPLFDRLTQWGRKHKTA